MENKFLTSFCRTKQSVVFEEPTLTKQSFKEQCDVNNILKKYLKTGVIEHAAHFKGDYGDFTTSLDYRSSLDALAAAEASFEALPSKVRKHFGNDPINLLRAVEDPSRKEELQKLGLLKSSDDLVSPRGNEEKSTMPILDVNGAE